MKAPNGKAACGCLYPNLPHEMKGWPALAIRQQVVEAKLGSKEQQSFSLQLYRWQLVQGHTGYALVTFLGHRLLPGTPGFHLCLR